MDVGVFGASQWRVQCRWVTYTYFLIDHFIAIYWVHIGFQVIDFTSSLRGELYCNVRRDICETIVF